MTEINFNGRIECVELDDFEHILLIQEDGYKIDLVYRLKEIVSSFPDKKVQVSYYVSDKLLSKDEVTEQFLSKLYGNINAGYEDNGRTYSEWTGFVESYDTVLEIGGHNLNYELYEAKGKFLNITFTLS